MGCWTFFLSKAEEKKIKELIAQGKFPSVYAFVRKAVQDFLASKAIEETKQKDYWWRHPKKE